MSLATTCPTVRRIAILTGGGDCPGLNAVIRAVARDALAVGIEVLGIEDGFLGLIQNRFRRIEDGDLSGLLMKGGTILGSNNKSNPARFPVGKNPDGSIIHKDVSAECLAHLKQREINAMVVIGGDGTLTSAAHFGACGVPVVGVPKTIDNDIEGTEITFGFQTAVTTATEAMDKVRTTADSHHRAMVVEVMGRNAGWIALHAGVAAGADLILIPEIPFSMESVCAKVQDRLARGKRSSLICIAEGAMVRGGKQMIARIDPTSPDPVRLGGIGKWVADQVEKGTGVESRFVVLGHIQRGGTPVAADRVLATLFGNHAMTLLREGKVGRMVAMRNGMLTDVSLSELAGKQRLVPADEPLIQAAKAVGTSFGE